MTRRQVATASKVGFDSGGGLGGDSWVVCFGHTRDVIDGRASCPRYGSVVTLSDCLGCHLLVTVAQERDRRRACSVPEREHPPVG